MFSSACCGSRRIWLCGGLKRTTSTVSYTRVSAVGYAGLRWQRVYGPSLSLLRLTGRRVECYGGAGMPWNEATVIAFHDSGLTGLAEGDYVTVSQW